MPATRDVRPPPGEQYRAVDQAEARLDELRAKRSQMASTYRSDSPVFQQMDAEIASLQATAKQRTKEAQSRASNAPNVVHQNINTDYLRASADADSAREPERVSRRNWPTSTSIWPISKRSATSTTTWRARCRSRTTPIAHWRFVTRRRGSRPTATRRKISAAAVIAAPGDGQSAGASATQAGGAVASAGGADPGDRRRADDRGDRRSARPRRRDVVRILRLPVLATFDTDI